MQTKITLIIDNPADVEAFESQFPALARRAAAFPGLVKIESGKVWPKEDGTATPAHRTLDLYFHDYDAASYAVTTQESAAFFEQLSALNVGFTGLFTQVDDGPVLPL